MSDAAVIKSPDVVGLDSVRTNLQPVKEQMNAIREFCFSVLKEGVDYGVIPGTSKKVLHKPGAEKLCQLLKLYPVFEPIKVVEDFDKPMFYFRYQCSLKSMVTGNTVATGIGSCNSMESKYRWRKADLKCPECGAEGFIKKSKFPNKTNGGKDWYCYAKLGGCGANFVEGDERITKQPRGRTENTDIFDQVNTIDKMAQKRALHAPVLIVAGVSEHFTQDLDDFIDTRPIQESTEGTKDFSPPPASSEGDTGGTIAGKAEISEVDYEVLCSSLRRICKTIVKKGYSETDDEAFQKITQNDDAAISNLDSKKMRVPSIVAKLKQAEVNGKQFLEAAGGKHDDI